MAHAATVGDQARIGVDHFIVDADRRCTVKNQSGLGESPSSPTRADRPREDLGAGLERDHDPPSRELLSPPHVPGVWRAPAKVEDAEDVSVDQWPRAPSRAGGLEERCKFVIRQIDAAVGLRPRCTRQDLVDPLHPWIDELGRRIVDSFDDGLVQSNKAT